MPKKRPESESARSTAKVFATALGALNAKVRRLVIMELVEDEAFREDLEAALLWEERKGEARRPFRDYLAEYEADQN